MFFGLSQVSPVQEQVAVDLGVSWISLQPSVLWFNIEQHVETNPGTYTWTALDADMKRFQDMGIDFTMLVSPVINAFTESTRSAIAARLPAEMQEHNLDSSSAFIHLLRDHGIAAEYDLKVNTPERLEKLKTFVRAAVDRYDFDGKNDMPGLKYEARNWHFVEEWPAGEIDGATYVNMLKAVYPVIKAENTNAIVIIPGLAGNYSQYFAFADGYIADSDAGRIKILDRVLTRDQVNQLPIVKNEKPDYELILKEGKGFFDAIDIHLYEPKETFTEGKLEWLKAKMNEYGCTRPIWVCEGGGPFKNGPADPSNPQGDPYFGIWTPKEGAEFVVKLLAMSAAKGVARNHWGLGTGEDGYWGGPWDVMGLVETNGVKKPNYYAYRMMQQKVKGFTAVRDLSFVADSSTRLFEFTLADGKKIYMAWDFSGTVSPVDVSGKIGVQQVRVSAIVTALASDNSPIELQPVVVSSKQVPLSVTPVFIEPVT